MYNYVKKKKINVPHFWGKHSEGKLSNVILSTNVLGLLTYLNPKPCFFEVMFPFALVLKGIYSSKATAASTFDFVLQLMHTSISFYIPSQ